MNILRRHRTCTRAANGVHIDTVNFSCNAIVIAINKLKPNLASGPDDLPPLLFKRLRTCLAEPLSMMFNSFFYGLKQLLHRSLKVAAPVILRITGPFH